MENNDIVSDFEQKQFSEQAVTSNSLDDLESIGDTYFGISWDEFLSLCEQQGFEVAFRQDFIDDHWVENHIEEEIVLIHKEKGLVLYANSYSSKTRINSANLYGEIKVKEGIFSQDAFNALEGYGSRRTEYGTQHISLDVREGMIASLSQLDGIYDFVVPWNELSFVWFLNYMEEDMLSDDPFDKEYEKINEQKISLMSPDAQYIVGFSSSKKL